MEEIPNHVLKNSSEKEYVEVTKEDRWGIINKTEAPLFECPRSISWAKIAQLMSLN